jgi:hypothetical protein
MEYISFLFLGDFYLKFIEAQVILIFFYSILSAFKITNNWLDLYIIFLSLTFLFMISRPFMHLFDLVDLINYDEAEWYRIGLDFYFKKTTMITINFVLVYTLLFLNIGYLYGYRKYMNISKYKVLGNSYMKIFNKKIAYFLFLIGGTAFLIKVFIYVKLLSQYGYVYLYSGNFSLPIIIRIFDDFFYIGYILLLVNLPTKKESYIISSIFILLSSSMLLTGMRGEFFVILFSVVWALSTIHQWKVKLYKIIMAGVSLILLGQSILLIKYSYIDYTDVNVIELVNLFIYSQGVSVLNLGYTIEFSDRIVDIYSGFRYFISAFVDMFFTLTGQTVPRSDANPDTIYDIGSRILILINPDGYHAGSGIGSSYISEFYALGGDVFLLSVCSFFLGLFIVFLSKKLIYQKYGLFITLIIVPMLFWLPRSTIGIIFKKYIFAYVLIIFLIFIYNLLITKKELKK